MGSPLLLIFHSRPPETTRPCIIRADSIQMTGGVGACSCKYPLTLLTCSFYEGRPALSKICFGEITSSHSCSGENGGHYAQMTVLYNTSVADGEFPFQQESLSQKNECAGGWHPVLACGCYSCTHWHTHKHIWFLKISFCFAGLHSENYFWKRVYGNGRVLRWQGRECHAFNVSGVCIILNINV